MAISKNEPSSYRTRVADDATISWQPCRTIVVLVIHFMQIIMATQSPDSSSSCSPSKKRARDEAGDGDGVASTVNGSNEQQHRFANFSVKRSLKFIWFFDKLLYSQIGDVLRYH